MKHITMVLLFALAVPLFLNGANVYIWHYDPADTFYCPDAGGYVNTLYWVQTLLTAQGHTCTVDTFLPSNVNSYDVVFALCGWYSC
jgi:hypothetical protein